MSADTENINHNDFPNICRTCLNICDTKFFGDHIISNIFYKLTDIHFKANDDLPQQLCFHCFEKINEIHEFEMRCKQSHSTLTKCLNTKRSEKQDDVECSDEDVKHKFEIKSEENFTIGEETFIQDENLIPSNNDINDELKTLEDNFEIAHHELIGNIIPETQEISDDDIINNVENAWNKTSENEDISNNDINWSGANSNLSEYSSSSFIGAVPVVHRPMRPHMGKGPFKCDQCSKILKRSDILKAHMLTHTGERPFKCDQCSKSFARSNTLHRHMRTHREERLYKCEHCSKLLLSAAYLRRHLRKHSKERPHKCDQCFKSFRLRAQLRKHIWLHSGERPYKCDQCPKSFAESGYFKHHLRLHRGERPYKCDVCSKSFSRPVEVKRHMRIHTNVLPSKSESSKS